MIASVLFYLAVYLQGLAWALLVAGRVGATTAAVLAYPLGLVLWVAVSALFAFSPLPYRPLALLLAWLGLGAVAGWRLWRRGPPLDRRAWRALAAGSGAFAGVAAALHAAHVSIATFDSHMIVILGRSMAFHGEPLPDLGGWFQGIGSRGLFQVFVQGSSLFLGVPYLQAATPLLAASFAAAFVHLGARGLAGPGGRSRAALGLAALTVAAMGSAYFMLAQAFYVHDNYAAGVYLCLFAASFWLAEAEREPAWLPFAFAFLFGFAVMRTETVLPALLFLAIAHSQTSLASRALAPWLVGWVVAVELWFLLLSPHLQQEPGLLTPMRRGLLMGAVALAGPGLALLRHPLLAGLRRRLPALLVIGLAVAVAFALVVDAEKTARSLGVLIDHVADASWGGIWFVLPVLWILASWLPPLPLQALFRAAPLAYLLLIVLLAFLRLTPYRPGWSDSGNRMLTHVVAVGFFGLLLFYGRGLVARPRAPA